MGADTERPSSKSTVKVSSVTRTFFTRGILFDTKVLIPRSPKFTIVTIYQLKQACKLRPGEAFAAIESDGL